MKNKWLKKGLLIAVIGCMTFAMTGCKGEEMIDQVLEKINPKEAEEETEEEISLEPEVNVAKPELTANLSGSVTYKTGEAPEILKVEATSPDGGEISYQWYKSLTNTNGGGTLIEDATESTFAPPTLEEGLVYYYAVATSTIGNSTNGITSDTIEVIVSDNPEAAENPAEGEEKPAEEKPAEGETAQ